MTQTFAVNGNNDIFVAPNGNLAILQGQPAVEATAASTSKARLGEEVLAQTSGMPFFEAVFNGAPNLAVYENSLLNALLALDGVTGVNSITSVLAQEDREGKMITVLKYSALIVNRFGLEFEITGSFAP